MRQVRKRQAIKSRELIVRTLPTSDALSQAVDALREQAILLQRYRELLDRQAEEEAEAERVLLETMEQENRRLEDRIRELIERQLEKQQAGGR